jgi:hypothetical protein
VDTNRLTVQAAYLDPLDATVAHGHHFDAATSQAPVAVLGAVTDREAAVGSRLVPPAGPAGPSGVTVGRLAGALVARAVTRRQPPERFSETAHTHIWSKHE